MGTWGSSPIAMGESSPAARDIQGLYAELRSLNPARAQIFAREDTLLCKNMGISHVQGNRLASRGRYPVRAFGSTKMEHQVLTQVSGTPVSDRRRSEMLRYLNAYTHMPAATTAEMLHSVRRFN